MPQINLDPIREELNAPDPVPIERAYARLSLLASREVDKFKAVYVQEDVAVASNAYMVGALATDADFEGFLPADPFIPDNDGASIDWMNPADVSMNDERLLNPLGDNENRITINEESVQVTADGDGHEFDIPEIEPTQFGNAFVSREDRKSSKFMVNVRMMHRMLMALAPGQADMSSVAAINFDRDKNSEKSPMKIFTRSGVGIFMPMSTDKGEEVVQSESDDDE